MTKRSLKIEAKFTPHPLSMLKSCIFHWSSVVFDIKHLLRESCYKHGDRCEDCDVILLMMCAVAVDASEAGAGNLEVVVRATKTGARIPHFLEADDRSTGLFQIRFSPPPGCFRYEIDVSFNDLSVDGQCVQWSVCPVWWGLLFLGSDDSPSDRQ